MTRNTFFILALSILVTNNGMGCLPNIFHSEWQFNLFGPKITDRDYKYEGYQRNEKNFGTDEMGMKIEPLKSSATDITGEIRFPEGDSLNLRYKRQEKDFL